MHSMCRAQRFESTRLHLAKCLRRATKREPVGSHLESTNKPNPTTAVRAALASGMLHPEDMTNMRRLAKILLPIGLAGAGGTGLWWIVEGGPNYGPPIVYLAFSLWVVVVLGALATLKLTRSRSRT